MKLINKSIKTACLPRCTLKHGSSNLHKARIIGTCLLKGHYLGYRGIYYPKWNIK